jgi:hypothetical protein
MRDHFNPPLSTWRPWHSCHHALCVFIAGALNPRLPAGYIAVPNIQYNVEIDVATLDQSGVAAGVHGTSIGGAARDAGGATATLWTPPRPTQTLKYPIVSDTVEVLVYREEGGLKLVAAIELVSPANKDSPANREAFVSKCESFLQQGAGLLVLDIVTRRRASLHNELLDRVGDPSAVRLSADLYVASYHPVDADGETRLDVWQEPLQIGHSLPDMPLWIRGGICVPVELGKSYDRMCELMIIDPA